MTAVLNDDGTIGLSNDTGNNIVIGGTSAATIAKAGFTSGTSTGFVALESLTGGEISVQANNPANGFASGAGTLADVKTLGLNETAAGTSFTSSAVSALVIARGFSQTTCLPARIARRHWSKWCRFGEAM